MTRAALTAQDPRRSAGPERTTPAPLAPGRPGARAALALQRAAGNAATGAVLRAPAAAASSTSGHRAAAGGGAGGGEGARVLARAVAERRSAGAPPRRMLQRMAPCPARLMDADPVPAGWKPYFGPSAVFHCGFRTILEDRAPAAGDPMNECVYDHSGTLVDDTHPYAGCKGTPDQYDSKKDPIKHATIDSGGIVRAGAPALADSVKHAVVEPVAEWLGGLDREIRRLYGAP